MSQVTIQLTDTNEGLVAVEIKVSNFDETSGAVALGERLQDFLNRVVQEVNEPTYPGIMANILTSRIQ